MLKKQVNRDERHVKRVSFCLFVLCLHILGLFGIATFLAMPSRASELYSEDFSTQTYLDTNSTGNWIMPDGKAELTKSASNSAVNIQERVPSVVVEEVSFVSVTTGWAVGENKIYKTTDGGANWTIQGTSLSSGFTYKDVHFIDTNNGWIVGGDGLILRTSDGGSNWSEQTSGVVSYLNAVHFENSSLGWTAGDSGVILKTTNGGTDWVAQTSGTSETLNGIGGTGNNICIVGAGGIVLQTTDGGSNWNSRNSGILKDLWSVTMYDTGTFNYAWAVGSTGNIIASQDNGITWASKASGTEKELYDVDFIDANYGWAIGEGGTILKTTNGGTNWTAQEEGSFGDLYAVDVVNNSNVWAGGTSLLITTTDGTNWTSKSTGTNMLVYESFVLPSDNDHIWIAGGGGNIYVTTDGGTNWTAQTIGTGEVLRGVHFIDANYGWAVGDSGTILNTTDGGSNWGTQVSPTGEILYDVDFIDANYGWAIGGSKSDGVVIKTEDSGANWSIVSTQGSTIEGVDFVDANNGWFVGDGGLIGKTTDGGSSWSTQLHASSENIYGVSFIDSTYGWAVGASGLIIATSDGGTTWTQQSSGIGTDLLEVSFYDANYGTAVGNDEVFLLTTNGGQSWVTVPTTGSSTYLYDVQMVSDTTIFYAGADGYVYKDTATSEYDPSSTIFSLEVDSTDSVITSATLTVTESKPTGTDISYSLSADGGNTWESVTVGDEHIFVAEGSDLRWKAEMTTTDSTKTPTITALSIAYEIASSGRRRDIFSPDSVSGVAIEPYQDELGEYENAVKLTWQNPDDEDLCQIRIYRSNIEGVVPNEFLVNFYSLENEFIDNNLELNIPYYYSFATIDRNGNVNLDETQYAIVLVEVEEGEEGDVGEGNGMISEDIDEEEFEEIIKEDQEKEIDHVDKLEILLPQARNLKAENQWIGIFGAFFGRLPKVKNEWEFVVYGAYDYQPVNRNLIKEIIAIGKFVDKFSDLPRNSLDWQIVSALAYASEGIK